MSARDRFRADVEGLRAVAVLAVVAFHAGVGAAGGGFVGVDVFYVLSGFLITGLLWEEVQATGRLRFRTFYARRARRLLPAAFLVLVVTVAASSVWLSPLQARVVAKDGVAAALYVANYRFAALRTDYLAETSPSPLQHYWSLGVEEQFYLLWPLLLLAVFLAGRRLRTASPAAAATAFLALTAIASFALSLWLTAVSQPWAFFSLPTRAWELTAGGLVALSAPHLRRMSGVAATTLGWLGLEAVIWSITELDPSIPFPGTAALFPVGGTVAVLAAGCAAPRLGPGLLLGQRPLQLGGKLSYAWYLWHWPLLLLVPTMAGHALGLGQRLSLAAASGLLALATVKLVEDPVRYAPWLRASPARSLTLGAALTGVAAAAALGTATVLPSPYGQGLAAPPAAIRAPRQPARKSRTKDPDEARLASLSAPVMHAVAHAVTARTVPANLDPPLDRAHANQPRPALEGCLIRWLGVTSGPCVYGTPASHTTVVLYGDSHALQWFPALDRAARGHRWRLESLTKTTCPPVQLSFWSPVLGRPYRECDQWRANTLARIRAERPALVVLGAARHYGDVYHFQVYGPAWLSGLARTVRQVRATGAQVLVLGPTPKPRVDVPDCLSRHLHNAAACTTPRHVAVNIGGEEAERQAVLRAGGSYLDVTPWLCTNSTCAVMVGNLLAYRDDNHLATTYSSWLAPLLADQADRSLHAVRP